MNRRILLDVGCKAGGATRGYQRAGFFVVGLDIEPQPHYIGDDFIQADMFQWLPQHGRLFDAIHVGPVCKRYSSITKTAGTQDIHPDQIPPVRDMLNQIGRHYIIENVEGAPLNWSLRLCGTMFPELRVERHRLFEMSFVIPIKFGEMFCRHYRKVAKHGRPAKPNELMGISGHFSGVAEGRAAMGIDWDMTQDDVSQAIPPAYTEYIGKHLMKAIA